MRRIDEDELADVFAKADVDLDGETVRAFHKGTLLALSAEADTSTHPQPPGSCGERGRIERWRAQP